MRLNIRLRDNAIRIVVAEPVSVPGFNGFHFFLHKDPFDCLVISEWTAGMMIARGTPKGSTEQVVAQVQRRLALVGTEVFRQKIKAAQLEFGIANEVPA